jgi:thioredoxin-related protein
MDAVTYPNEAVQKMLSESFVALKSPCSFAKPTDMMKKYHVRWTPTFVILDPDGNARHHMVGYMPPEELVAEIALLRAMEKLDKGDFKTAIEQLREIADKNPNTGAAPQALFYLGVAGYKSSHDPKKLKETHLELKKKYPENLWAKKSTPYGEIPG